MTVRTVLFDAGMTLVGAAPSFPEVIALGAADGGLELELDRMREHREAIGGLFRSHDEAWRNSGRTSPHVGDPDTESRYWHELYCRIIAHLEPEADADHVAAHIVTRFTATGSWQPFEDTRAGLEDLRSRGVRVGLVSNWASWLRQLLADLELDGYFETMVISGEERVEKPDPAIFQLALDRLGETADPGVVYVGDDLRCDVAPCGELGITPVLIDRWDRHPDHAGHRVTDLHGLADVLDLPAHA